MDRSQKEEQVAVLKHEISESELVVVTHYIGITMPEMTILRKNMREAGASLGSLKIALHVSPFKILVLNR